MRKVSPGIFNEMSDFRLSAMTSEATGVIQSHDCTITILGMTLHAHNDELEQDDALRWMFCSEATHVLPRTASCRVTTQNEWLQTPSQTSPALSRYCVKLGCVHAQMHEVENLMCFPNTMPPTLLLNVSLRMVYIHTYLSSHSLLSYMAVLKAPQTQMEAPVQKEWM